MDAIYLPENTFDIQEFVNNIKDLSKKKSSIVIAVSEGITTKDGKFVCEIGDEKKVDAFGHKQLSGTASRLASIVASETGLKTRAIEFSTLQRAATHLASLTDINEAYEVGEKAVSEANNGSTGKMVIITRENSKDYKSSTSVFDIHDIANVEKKVPASMIDSKNHQMTDEYLEYVKPLIMGELVPIFKDGLPQHLILK